MEESSQLERFYEVCEEADIEGAHPTASIYVHALRASVTTLPLENGAKPKAVQEILGHATLQMPMSVYARATDCSKRGAIDVLPFASANKPDYVLSLQQEVRRRAGSSPPNAERVGGYELNRSMPMGQALKPVRQWRRQVFPA